MSEDPYSALGLAKTATADEIKKAYKRSARESHPDLNPGEPKAADRFKAAAAAHDLLKDPEQRGRFDRGEIDAAGQERPERRFYREYAEGPDLRDAASSAARSLEVVEALLGRVSEGYEGLAQPAKRGTWR